MTMLGRKILAIACLILLGYQLVNSIICSGSKKKNKSSIYISLITSICSIVFISNSFN